jgi:hypothetical protein
MRYHLQPRQLLVLMDFTSVKIETKPGADVIVQDCIVVLEYLDESGARIRRNLNFLCDDHDTNDADFYFVLTVWVDLFQSEHLNERFDRIDIWSDGGPHHFKTRFCQFMWHVLSRTRFDQKPIRHHFFASYHGHSLADAHAAAVKRTLRSAYSISELQRITRQATAGWGPASAADLAALLPDACSNTQVKVYPDIDRNWEHKDDVRAIPAIKSYHCFEYQGGQCQAFECTGDANSVSFTF